MAGPSGAFRSWLVRLDPGGETLWVQLVRRRCEDDVDALGFRDLEVARLVARIRLEIRRLVELRRVDEQRHDHAVVLGASRAEEGAVAVVERSHGRHEAGPRSRRQLCDRADDLHASSTVASASVS